MRRGSLVDQQVAQVDIRVAEIVSEYPFTKVLEKQLAGRRLAKELSALMARAVESDIGFDVIGHETAEEGREQPKPILNNAGNNLLGVIGRSLLAEVDIAVDLPDQVDNGKISHLVQIRDRPQRCFKPYRAH